MAIKNLLERTNAENGFNKTQKMSYEEIEGIKLRDSLFAVYTESPDKKPEFFYFLKSMEDSGEMVFDINPDNVFASGGSENCGFYKLKDERVLKIFSMNNWHYKGYIFIDENSSKKFLERESQ